MADDNGSRGNQLFRRFEQSRDLATLDEAIRAYQLATLADPAQGVWWRNLAVALLRRPAVIDSTDDCVQAIDVLTEATSLVGVDHVRRTDLTRLQSLACSAVENASITARARFEQRGRPEDLAEAVSLARCSCRATAANDPRLAVRLTHLAGALMYQWELLPQRRLLDEAISSYDDALRLMPGEDPERAKVLSNLAGTLLMRAQGGGPDGGADLDWSIELFREATELPEGAHSLANLASALTARYRITKDLTDLDEAIEAGRRAVAKRDPADLGILADALALRAGHHGAHDTNALGEAIRLYRECLARRPGGGRGHARTRSDLGHALEQLDSTSAEAAGLFRQVAFTPDAPIHLRIEAAVARSRISNQAGDWISAADAAELAVELLPRAASEDLSRADQEHGLGRWSGLAAHAAACALQLGDAKRALRLLEDGHAVLLARASRDGQDDKGDPLAGAVVLVNATHLRNDALIVTGDGVSSIPLPGFTDVAQHLARFIDAQRAATHAPDPSERRQAQQVIHAELAWLWDRVSGPVLEHLGITGSPGPGEEWPRVWWVRSSLLAGLPLHAAGHHYERDTPHPRTVMDRVVSSYTPTAKVLRQPRQASAAPTIDSKLLIVAVPKAPGVPELPGVLREVSSLTKLVSADLLLGEQANRATVLSALKSHPMVHFACHGISNLNNPSASRLILHDHDFSPLTVRDVARQNLPRAGLAYLSACDTAGFSFTLADEAIHLTTAFQLAGYSHVIGMLWPIDDRLAAEIAELFYGELRTAGFNPDRSAFALHAAIRSMRDRFLQFPILWASHVHTGA
jgi:tetratricopeptide (TPR) repeat protein